MRKENIDFHVDLTQSILWQYNNAENLNAIISKLCDLNDLANKKFWEDWHSNVFNINTANDFGLEVWSRILNVKAGVSFEAQPEKLAFGLGKNRKNFNAPTNFGSRDGGYVGFTTEQKRLLVKSRLFQLTQSPTLTNINRFLKENLWKDDAKVFVTDPFDMTFALYTFNYQPDANIMFLIKNTDFLPRPSTVDIDFRIVGKTSFGVSKNRANFNKPTNFGKL